MWAAVSWHDAGEVLEDKGDYAAAIDAYKKTAAFFRDRGDERGLSVALNSTGGAYLRIQEYALALDEFEQALAIHRRLGDEDSAAKVLNNMGQLHSMRGEYERALMNYQEAAAIRKRISTDEDSNVWTMTNIGHIHEVMGDADSALRIYKEALAIAQRSLRKYYESGQKDPALRRRGQGQVMTCLNNIATIQTARGEYREAFENLKASQILAQMNGDLAAIATLSSNLGGLSRLLGYDEQAEKWFAHALSLYGELGDRSGLATTLANLAILADDAGDLPRALGYDQESLKALAPGNWPAATGGPWPNPPLSAVLLPDQALRFLSHKGEVLRRLSERDRERGDVPGETAGLLAARDAYRLSIEIVESLRAGLSEEEMKLGFMRARADPYEGVIKCLLRLHELEPGKGWGREAFLYSEKSKGRALGDLVRGAKAKHLAGIPPEVLRREKELELSFGALQAEAAKENDEEKQAALGRSLQEARKELNAFRKKLRDDHPRYAQAQDPGAVSTDQVRKMLKSGKTGFVEYFIGKDFVAFWGIARSGDDVFVSSGAADLAGRVDAYRKNLTSVRFTPEMFDLGRELYDQLFRPLEARFPGIERWIVAPDGVLCRLPLQTLIRGVADGTPRFLAEECAVSYVPSAAVLRDLRAAKRPKRHPETLLALGHPVYGGAEASPEKIRPPSEEIIRLAKRSADFPGAAYRAVLGQESLADLPATEKEVRGLAEVLRSPSYVFTRESATEDRVKAYSREGLLKKFKYLHFAMHGLVCDEAPALTSLAMSQDADGQEDGFLTVGEVYGLDISPDLVTLSACDLGLGQLVKGEGVMGLTRAFFYAGAPSVVVSLWAVADQSTKMFMEKFYAHMSRGASKSDALRMAQLDLMKESFTARRGKVVSCAAPMFWAPFALYGDPE